MLEESEETLEKHNGAAESATGRWMSPTPLRKLRRAVGCVGRRCGEYDGPLDEYNGPAEIATGRWKSSKALRKLRRAVA
jgi:hypothetical protein